jgi:NAD(P)-dependent dehydrogenase (short-subunit alcohol dehydrogenase family)
MTHEQLGPIDVLINNAGGGRSIGPVAEVDPDEWWASVEVNLRSVFLCCHSVLPSMMERGQGRIVNVSSGLALNPVPNGTAYSISKAAILRFTDSLALEVAAYGIQVFAMSPGMVHTANMDYVLESEAGRRWMPYMRQLPETTWVPAERGAELICRLAAGEADALSGRFIHVSDDLDDLVRRADEIRAADTLTLRLRR